MDHSLRLLLVFALSLAPALAADVHVVRSDGAGDFTNLQAGINAAASGDILLIQSDFSEQSVIIDGKGLVLVGELGQRPVIASALVRNVPADASVLLRGLEFAPPTTVGFTDSALRVLACLGPVMIEDCVLVGRAGLDLQHAVRGRPALTVGAASAVVVARSTLLGGNGHSPGDPFSAPPGIGGDALYAESAAVTLHACTLAGGDGGSALITSSSGAEGGYAIYAIDSELWFEGGVARGGSGGDGCSFVGQGCPWPAGCHEGNEGCVGGRGAVVWYDSRLQLRDAIVVGGDGGLYDIPGGPLQAPAGVDVDVALGGAVVDHAGGASHAIDVAPLRTGEPGLTQIVGPPGAFAAYALSFELDRVPLGGSKGVLTAGAPFLGPYLLGTIPASGVREFSYATPAIDPAFEGLVLIKQALVADGDGLRFGGPSSFIHLGVTP